MQYLKKFIGKNKALNKKALVLALGGMAVNFGTASAAELINQDVTVKTCSYNLSNTQYAGICNKGISPDAIITKSNLTAPADTIEAVAAPSYNYGSNVKTGENTIIADNTGTNDITETDAVPEKENIHVESTSVEDVIKADTTVSNLRNDEELSFADAASAAEPVKVMSSKDYDGKETDIIDELPSAYVNNAEIFDSTVQDSKETIDIVQSITGTKTENSLNSIKEISEDNIEFVFQVRNDNNSSTAGTVSLPKSNIVSDTFPVQGSQIDESLPSSLNTVENNPQLSSTSLDRPYLRTLDRQNPVLKATDNDPVLSDALDNSKNEFNISLLNNQVLNKMEIHDNASISKDQVLNTGNSHLQKLSTTPAVTTEEKALSETSKIERPVHSKPSRGYNYSHLLKQSAQPAPMDVKGVMSSVLPLSVEARFYAPHMNAKVKSDKTSYFGGEVSMKDTLGFGNNNAPELLLRYKRMSLDYIRVHGSASKDITSGSLTFDGKQFSGSTHSKNDLDYIRFRVDNPLLSVSGIDLDWNYGLTAIHWSGSVNGKDSLGNQQSASADYWIPIPTLGVGAHADLDPAGIFSAYASVSGLPMGGYGHFYDLEAGFQYKPLPFLDVTAGYRRINISAHHGDDNARVNMNGPYLGVRYSF